MSFAAALARDPNLELQMLRMELRFANLMSYFSLAFNKMLSYMKNGNITQYRAAASALREMSNTLNQAIATATRSLRSIPSLPLGAPPGTAPV